jgi:predicted dehydrogenase
MSFDAVATRSANIEIHGETGSLIVPDPNRFDGDVQLHALGSTEWETLPTSAGYVEAGRGVGIQDLALTETDAEPRASGRVAFHALDVMESLLRSAESGQSVVIESTCDRPAIVPLTELSVRA